MSLLVTLYQETATGALEEVPLEPRPDGSEPSLFGFERCRTQLWGAAFTRDLGLALLPTLAERDIRAKEGELRVLRQEAELLLLRRAELARATGYDEDYVELRLQNLLRAVAQAEAIEGEAGWVYVW